MPEIGHDHLTGAVGREADRRRSYSPEFYEELEAQTRDSASEIVPLVMGCLRPRSVVDVGCGRGVWLAAFKKHGVSTALGVDGSWLEGEDMLIPATEFVAADLEEQVTLGATFDLAVSLEVAEHLSPEGGERLVKLLTESAPVVLFSAAVPGQGGVDHVNEQWQTYWVERFGRRGFDAVDYLRPRLWDNPNVAWYYAQNCFLFVRASELEKHAALRSEWQWTKTSLIRMVHPKLYQHYVDLNDGHEAERDELLTYCENLRNVAPGSASLKKVIFSIPALIKHALVRRFFGKRIQETTAAAEPAAEASPR